MKSLPLALALIAATAGFAGKAAKKPAKHPSKASAQKPTKSNGKKVSVKAPPKAASNPSEADKACSHDLAWGRVQAVRDRCGDLQPRTSPAAAYWRLTLSDDPNDLRKGFAPSALGKGEVDSRLLLAAGRYHFARGQRKEMEDLVEIARKKKIADPRIDTLKRLAAGQ